MHALHAYAHYAQAHMYATSVCKGIKMERDYDCFELLPFEVSFFTLRYLVVEAFGAFDEVEEVFLNRYLVFLGAEGYWAWGTR